jgi:hypothetical protein
MRGGRCANSSRGQRIPPHLVMTGNIRKALWLAREPGQLASARGIDVSVPFPPLRPFSSSPLDLSRSLCLCSSWPQLLFAFVSVLPLAPVGGFAAPTLSAWLRPTISPRRKPVRPPRFRLRAAAGTAL